MGWSDEALMERLRRGDMRAFDALYQRHRQPLFSFVARLLQDHALAEDVYQEIFMRLLQRADRFKVGAKFSTWLYAIAHNLCMDQLRSRQKRRANPPALQPEPAPDPQERVLARETAAMAHRLLADLPPQLRAVVVLRVLHDCSQEETARIVGVPVGTVKSRLHHALHQLRRKAAE